MESRYAKKIGDETRDRLVGRSYPEAIKQSKLSPVTIIDLQPEGPIYIGHGSVGRTVFNDVGSDNGESLFIEDSTGNFTFLLLWNGHFPFRSFFSFDLCFAVYKNILPRYFIGEGGVFGELIEYFVDGLVFEFHIIKYGTIDIAAFIKENKF